MKRYIVLAVLLLATSLAFAKKKEKVPPVPPPDAQSGTCKAYYTSVNQDEGTSNLIMVGLGPNQKAWWSAGGSDNYQSAHFPNLCLVGPMDPTAATDDAAIGALLGTHPNQETTPVFVVWWEFHTVMEPYQYWQCDTGSGWICGWRQGQRSAARSSAVLYRYDPAKGVKTPVSPVPVCPDGCENDHISRSLLWEALKIIDQKVSALPTSTPVAAQIPSATQPQAPAAQAPVPAEAPSPKEQAKRAQQYADCLKMAVDNPSIVCKQ